ncbi:DUF308 domain-containing protein [Lactobacillus xylocopicola]|uniref:Immunity protein n=1 Tax=Lactobacillus xylocopicola TaxID=2976676 RepID=A0ABM8BHT3_9LACO|nr:DUF308 domain-containing protein [Lactobacillus xylocopicola]BDR60851.1 hypothetical protein KIM322_11120 [Lactobacillus xylocopicola]
MNLKINLVTAIIVLIVGLYDLAYGYNRRNHNRGSKPFMLLGTLFTIAGIGMLIAYWLG